MLDGFEERIDNQLREISRNNNKKPDLKFDI